MDLYYKNNNNNNNNNNETVDINLSAPEKPLSNRPRVSLPLSFTIEISLIINHAISHNYFFKKPTDAADQIATPTRRALRGGRGDTPPPIAIIDL